MNGKYSELLAILIGCAKEWDGGASALTAETFFAAILDQAEDEQFLAHFDEEFIPAINLLARGRPDFSQARAELTEYIRANQKNWFTDVLYMRRKLAEAEKRAEEDGASAVRLDLVVRCILDEPRGCIKKWFVCEDSGGTSPGQPTQEGPVLEDDNETWEGAELSLKEEAAFYETAHGFPGEPCATSKNRLADAVRDAKQLQEKLSNIVFGQAAAVSEFAAGCFRAELLSITDRERVRPRAAFLFVGPPGVGKTFLAEKAAELLGLPFMRFDMSEYADVNSCSDFSGSDKSYSNAREGNVTGFVAENPESILLFDEIEKAHSRIINLFLQILDAGRLRDNCTDEEVSFAETILIFTTNAGTQLYEGPDPGDFSGVSRRAILSALRKDINPATRLPYFPPAICSRFASGNVIMFNTLKAHELREIAKREILRHGKNFSDLLGIDMTINDHVYTALLLAEGGYADARAIRGRAEAFLNDEVFELFRLITSDQVEADIQDIGSITVEVELPDHDSQLRTLFECEARSEILLFSSEYTARVCRDAAPSCDFLNVRCIKDADKVLRTHDIRFILTDLSFGQKRDTNYLNREDILSPARDFLRFAHEKFADTPMYLLETPDAVLSAEERRSFVRLGVRGTVALLDERGDFEAELEKICRQLHQQDSIMRLAKANKVVAFETAQSLLEGGRQAKITLFDFGMRTAVDVEDSENLLSGISKPNVRFDQVIGAGDAKRELLYFVNYLKNPKNYLDAGIGAPKGVLLYGPPGTGKTMLAKAMACESDATFIAAEGNQFLKKYVGEGPELVHRLFRIARKYAPSILFVDEIDAVARRRTGSELTTSREEILTAFLTEMDGFRTDPLKPVFVLAATNLGSEAERGGRLDPALMRRFDRRICIDLPNRDERTRYLQMRLAATAFEISDEKLENLAVRSTGMSLAELGSVLELALRLAVRDGNLKVTDEILDEAFETFHYGETKKWDISQLERTARHEAGHAFLCWQSGEVPSYITITARADHGGYMQHSDNEDKTVYTKDELLALIRTALGGRAAEIVYYGRENGVSTSASGDLAKATRLARQILCRFGMDDKFGLAVVDVELPEAGALSAEVKGAVDQILAGEMDKAVRALDENRRAIDALAAELLSKNHLSGSEAALIFSQAASSTAEQTGKSEE